MFGLSASHILILGVIVLLFGSRRLPELGSNLGKALHAFKAATEARDENAEELTRLERVGEEKPKQLT
jgi:sec-independent protein translocase protein TatA